MIRLSTHYTSEKVRVYDADDVDALIVEIEESLFDVEDYFRVISLILPDNNLSREECRGCLQSFSSKIRRNLNSVLVSVHLEVRE